jgi:glycosyltransferase involved in cell wall biosynthesis
MNVLVILNDLDIGGAQTYTIGLMNEFVKMGHSVSLRILSDNMLLKERLCGGIDIKIWPRRRKLDINILRKIRKEIKQGKFDGIISSYDFYQKLATLLLPDNPVTIYPVHSTVELNKKAHYLNSILFRLKKRNEIYLTSIKNQTVYLTQSHHLKNGFFSQILNGVDTDKFTLPPGEFDRKSFLVSKGINHLNRNILMVAGFREEKRHVDAIEAFKILKEKNINVSLIFVGDNRKDECIRLMNYSATKNLKDIHFFTADIAGDVRDFYWSSDIFTLTSNKVETFPISALEAMASGLPCVLTNTGGAMNLISENKNGIIVEPENPLSISNGWLNGLALISASRSNLIREEIVSKYSLKESAKQYIGLMKIYNVN